MKFIYSVITLLTFSLSGYSQNGIYVKYETELSGEGENAEMMAMMMNGSTMEIASSEERTWVETKMGTMMTLTLEMDTKSKDITMLMTGLAGNMAFQGNEDELNQEETEPDASVKFYDETKIILGYKCKKATAIDANGNIATHWYTEKIKRPEGVNQMSEQIPGISLQFEMEVQDGLTIIYTAVEADKKVNMDDYSLQIPAGVEVKSLAEMAQMGMGGK